MKTSELEGAALDWAVELATGTFWSANGYFCFDDPKRFDHNPEWHYSTDWSAAGPIIERECIDVAAPDEFAEDERWFAAIYREQTRQVVPRYCEMRGDTPLVAAMRAFVASKLGAEVDIPEGLVP